MQRKGRPLFYITDLNSAECPPTLRRTWLPVHQHPNLLFLVAVREVEAWVLAHRDSFANFLGIRDELLPENADAIINPKRYLITLASMSPRRELRRDIVPPLNSTRQQGPNYNGCLGSFVENLWSVAAARLHSPSLMRAADAVAQFSPTWAR